MAGMTAKTTRNARSRTQRGQARAALETQRTKVKLQEDHLTALFTHLDGIDQARLQAGEQVSILRKLGLTLGEIAELTGEPVNRLSWLSRLSTDDGEDDAKDAAEAGGQETSVGGAPAGEENAQTNQEGLDPAEAGAAGGHQTSTSITSVAGEPATTGGRLQA